MAQKSVRKRYVYMAVTGDKFELPICAADTLKELSHMVGRSANAISSSMSRDRRSLRKRRYNVSLRFVKIENDGVYPSQILGIDRLRIHKDSISGWAIMQALKNGNCETDFQHNVDATRFAKNVRNAIYYHGLNYQLWVEQRNNVVWVHCYE